MISVLRYFDIVLVLVTAPVAVIVGAPALGTLVGGAAWIVQRFIAFGLESRAKRTEDVRTAIGINLGGAFVRAWVLGLVILLVGKLGSSDDGLAAAILVLIAFTIYLVATLVSRSLLRSSAAA
ncbi:MAG TPA: hypothetical protein PKB03_04190 [Baekduia sp.]|nr:hypothetical protein [Baekduia sp.]